MSEKKLVGLEIVDEQVNLEGQDLVAKATAQHVGKYASFKLTAEGKVEFLPFVNKGIDMLEKIIPGDQTAVATMLKNAVAMIKIKL